MSARPEPRVLTDPQAIKALAHPARLTVLDALTEGEELTATECAEVAGISPSAMSYHLRALEKWGFVERAESSGDGRERPWRAVAGGWRVDRMPDAVAVAASSAVVNSMLDRLRVDVGRWFDAERTQPAEWQHVASVEAQHLWLTPDEAGELGELYQRFVEARKGRTAAEHPDGARRVRLARVLVPVQLD
ncbi:MAG TPA: metalloregulator ArsR/SmtB family transcription factor [Jatrophihabitans sp.]|uniref:ArsR/SmtB family transcription factor n=1 Tax=Jatrophihabitans sp. TaxID=1932789 RepID=UPI002DFEF791|nr:metalloregulator ArsR/SmtB family transcription factor [Jatrophihabitans sp.]